MNQQMKILKEIAQTADRNDFYSRAKQLGKIASKAFAGHRSQMTNLENIANSTLKVTDVLDYIKKQVAKNKMWRRYNFGTELKKYIENSLRKRREEICSRIEGVEENSFEGQRIYLNLIREFVRQLVVHYEYREPIGDEHNDGDN